MLKKIASSFLAAALAFVAMVSTPALAQFQDEDDLFFSPFQDEDDLFLQASCCQDEDDLIRQLEVVGTDGVQAVAYREGEVMIIEFQDEDDLFINVVAFQDEDDLFLQVEGTLSEQPLMLQEWGFQDETHLIMEIASEQGVRVTVVLRDFHAMGCWDGEITEEDCYPE